MKQTTILFWLLCFAFIASAQSTKQEAYSEFISAKNAPYHNVLAFGNYYRVDEFNRLGEAAQRLYNLTNQDETVERLRTANRELQDEKDALTRELDNLRRTPPPMTAAIATTTRVQPNGEDNTDEDNADEEEVTPTRNPKKKGKTFTDWLVDNALVLILLLAGGSYYIYEKRKKTTV